MRGALRREGRALAFGAMPVTLGLLLSACAPENVSDRPPEETLESSPDSAGPTEQERSEVERAAATLALRDAVAAGDIAGVRDAVGAGADLEVRGSRGRTPLVEATKAERTEIAVLLLDAGADPDAKDDMQDSAFLYAGAEGLDEILRAALEHGADATSTNRYGGTALIPASEHGHVSTVEILIDAGVPLDHVNNLGWTALQEAIVLGTGGPDHVRVVRALLAAGADPELPDGNGVAPRDLAATAGHWDLVTELDRVLGS